MQRNPDILRDIMLAAEAQPAGRKLYASAIKTVSSNSHELADHVQQLIDIGYLDATVHMGDVMTPSKAVICRVKGPGHDFLQAMREDTIWKMVKEKVMKPTASWTLVLAVEWAQQYIRKQVGLP